MQENGSNVIVHPDTTLTGNIKGRVDHTQAASLIASLGLVADNNAVQLIGAKHVVADMWMTAASLGQAVPNHNL